MQGRDTFSDCEAQAIRALLARKLSAGREEQKAIRGRLRGSYGFYISDFSTSHLFGPVDFDCLVSEGRVTIGGRENAGVAQARPTQVVGAPDRRASEAGGRDEHYVLDLCDRILSRKSLRQYQFPFLCGDSGRTLPVDAYYPDLGLVIEYREIQHTERVPFFDRRQTVSGVSRGEQRRLYDQRRRDELPRHGLTLVEIPYWELAHDPSRRLKRDPVHDEAVLRRLLAEWVAQG